jgi:hypothetical protein
MGEQRILFSAEIMVTKISRAFTDFIDPKSKLRMEFSVFHTALSDDPFILI